MNPEINSNIKLSDFYGNPLIRKQKINKGITDKSVKNITQRYKEIELENKINKGSKKTNSKIQKIIEVCAKVNNSNKAPLILLNKNQFNLNLSKSENLKNLNSLNTLNTELTKPILNDSNSILMNERQYIELLSPFNSELASYTNHIYTFTNRPSKQINKILYNIYTIFKSAFLNMSCIISKPIVSINPNLIKITLFYY
jgi:hypothetical protein